MAYARGVVGAGLPGVWWAVTSITGLGLAAVGAWLLDAGVAWSATAVLVGVLWVAGVGGYRSWSRLERQLSLMAGRPVLPEHARDLRTRLHALMDAVASARPGSYGDPIEGRAIWREQLGAHFPYVIRDLEAWNAVFERDRAAPVRLSEAFHRALRERGFDPHRYSLETLVDALAGLTVSRSRAAQLHVPFDPKVDAYPDEVGFFSLYARDWAGVWAGIALAEGLLEAECDVAISAIRSLFTDAQDWPEAHEVGRAREALDAFHRIRLRDDLAALHQRQEYRVAPGCPACGERDGPILAPPESSVARQ